MSPRSPQRRVTGTLGDLDVPTKAAIPQGATTVDLGTIAVTTGVAMTGVVTTVAATTGMMSDAVDAVHQDADTVAIVVVARGTPAAMTVAVDRDEGPMTPIKLTSVQGLRLLVLHPLDPGLGPGLGLETTAVALAPSQPSDRGHSLLTLMTPGA